jgi:hypothetical protein
MKSLQSSVEWVVAALCNNACIRFVIVLILDKLRWCRIIDSALSAPFSKYISPPNVIFLSGVPEFPMRLAISTPAQIPVIYSCPTEKLPPEMLKETPFKVEVLGKVLLARQTSVTRIQICALIQSIWI